MNQRGSYLKNAVITLRNLRKSRAGRLSLARGKTGIAQNVPVFTGG
jgi:hypothetical protein